ncbi:MAG: hypothetical protein NZL89_01405 [Leptospiraceae bacterium]|nr:hypothetical protein [Leptospiraceae bacterium]
MGTLSLVFLLAQCNKYVYEHREGRLSRGTFEVIKRSFYEGQFEEEETKEARNRKIIADIAELDALGVLATRKGLKQDPYYGEYLFRQKVARYGRVAITHWREKYGDKFNWQMIFPAENLIFDAKKAVAELKAKFQKNESVLDHKIAEFEGRPVFYRNLKPVLAVSDYEQMPGFTEAALESGLRDALKLWLEKQIHDRVVWQFSADEQELRRFDHNKVAVLYLKVKYGKAGKGIYPAAMDNIPLTPVEIYDHFHKMQNTLAEVLWVKAAYTVVAEENIAEEIIAKLDQGADFVELARRYAIDPRFVETAKPHVIRGYGKDVLAREKRSYYDRLILDMAGRDISKPDPYLGKDGIVVARIYDVGRALEKVKLQDVMWKVENDLRTRLLNEVFDHDVRDTLAALRVRYNERLIRSLN